MPEYPDSRTSRPKGHPAHSDGSRSTAPEDERPGTPGDHLSTTPEDICLMLRAHAELSCLSVELMPVLRQLESREELPDEQIGAALAYLEVTWLEAGRRAAETDAAHADLIATRGGLPGAGLPSGCEDDRLCGKACRYHRAVKELREKIAIRVAPLLASPEPARRIIAVRPDGGEARPLG